MDYSASKNPEKLNPLQEKSDDNSEKLGVKESFQSHSKEVKEATDTGKSAYIEAVGLDESAETSGKVSEILTDTKEQNASSAASTSRTQKFTAEQIKAQLLKKLPPEKEMRKQIEKEIKKEIDYLHSKAMGMVRRPGEANYFEMSNLMRKIRELKGILCFLLKSSFDNLKTLWLRYVHGVM